METTYLPPALGVFGMIVAFIIYGRVKAMPAGEGKLAEIAEDIHLGAMVFMKSEYSILAPFALVVAGLLYMFLGAQTTIAFVAGAFCSGIAGYIGMFTATKANVRTTTAAHTQGAAAALKTAFFGGSVLGLTIASVGLLGCVSLELFVGGDPETAHAIHGFGMGASTVALFSRVGGGIFTKSADVGADLVGKIEAGIPEDDPRNPGVIADIIGDNAWISWIILRYARFNLANQIGAHIGTFSKNAAADSGKQCHCGGAHTKAMYRMCGFRVTTEKQIQDT